ncbi:MAG: ankyrin repeat domain-containing protein [Alphaproteobacteria bacterium]|nr:ankyrin repeat domain-containing protein [Alphaproteobacteria bacterium]
MLKAQEYDNGIQDILDKPLVFAQIVSQSVVWYLGRYPLSSNNNEEKIRMYGRQLINQIMTTKDTKGVYNTIKQKNHNLSSPKWLTSILESDSSDLIQAIIKDDYKTFKSFVSRDIDVHTRDKIKGYSPLMIALLCQSHPIYVNDLIDAGADIEDWYQNKNPLIMAIESSNDLGAVMLLQRGANPHIEYDGENLISLATKRVCPRFVEYLIENDDVDVNMELSDEISLLHYTAKYGLINAVKKILQQGFPVDFHIDSSETALISASREGASNVVRLLLDSGADVNAICGYTKRTALMNAVQNGNVDIVQMLLEAGADVHTKEYWNLTAFLIAADEANPQCVEKLIKAGSDVHVTSDFYGDKSTALILLSQNRDKQINDIIQTAKLLIDAGVDVNAQNEAGKTALMNAVFNECIPLVELLIQSGADVTLKDENNKTALQDALKNVNTNILKILQKAGGKITDLCDDPDKNSNALMLLCDNRSLKSQEKALEMAKWLIENGIDVNAQNSVGKTALMYAVSTDNKALVEFLIQAGADKDLRDNLTHTAWNYVTEEGFSEIVKIMRETMPIKNSNHKVIMSKKSEQIR